eukprot:7004348-Pyramimonas_sp.AAC.1
MHVSFSGPVFSRLVFSQSVFSRLVSFSRPVFSRLVSFSKRDGRGRGEAPGPEGLRSVDRAR